MPLKQIALSSLIIALILMSVAVAYPRVVSKQRELSRFKVYDSVRFYKVMYGFCVSLPLIKYYVYHIQMRLMLTKSNDLETIKVKTAKTMSLVFIAIVGIFLLMLQFVKTIQSWLFALLVLVFIAETVLDYLVNRQSLKLLMKQIDFNETLRAHYFESFMIDDALYSSMLSLSTKGEEDMLIQAQLIYDVLESNDGESALERYCQVAPNNYLKLLAGTAYMTKEYGDSVVDGSSTFAKALNLINQELRDEVLLRDRLNFALKSMNVVAVAPLFTLGPLRTWASTSFIPLQKFYASHYGFVLEIAILVILLLAYLLLKRVQSFQSNVSEEQLFHQSSRLISKNFSRLLSMITPTQDSKKGRIISTLHKKALSREPIEQFYARKLVMAIMVSSFTCIIILCALGIAINQVVYAPFYNTDFYGGEYTENHMDQLREEAKIDRKIIRSLNNDNLNWKAVEILYGEGTLESDIAYKRIQQRLVLKKVLQPTIWHGVLIYLSGVLGWLYPTAMLWFQKRLVEVSTTSEIARFQLVIIVLMPLKHMTVDQLLVWLERFSLVFKMQLQRAILDYDSGAQDAIRVLKSESRNSDYQKMMYQLEMAIESLTIQKAFEELDLEKHYYHERRKIAGDRDVAAKIQLGQIIGFTPIYATIVLYFMVPMIYASTSEMQRYFEVLSGY